MLALKIHIVFWLLLTAALSPSVAQYSLHAQHDDTVFVDKLPLSFSVGYSLEPSGSGEFLFGFAACLHFEHSSLQDTSCRLRWQNLPGQRLLNYLTSQSYYPREVEVAVTGLEPSFSMPLDTPFLEAVIQLSEADTSVREVYLYATAVKGNDRLGKPLTIAEFRDTLFLAFAREPEDPGTVIVDPGNGTVRIRFDRSKAWEEVEQLRLISPNGRVIQLFEVYGPELEFSTQSWYPGIYLVEFQFYGGERAVRKLIIRK